MKKIILSLTVFAATLTSCSYNDAPLWDAVGDLESRIEKLEQFAEQTNKDIDALEAIVSALQKNVSITEVTKTENGYTVKFSDGTDAVITNGKDGADAPVVSCKVDTDGVYYWTIGGEWMLDENGEKLQVEGASAVAPQIQINADTLEWEVSTDGGNTWVSTGVKAAGEDGDSFFTGVDYTSSDEYVIFTLEDGSEIKLAKFAEMSCTIENYDGSGILEVAKGETSEFNVVMNGAADFIFSVVSQGDITASFKNDVLTIVAPDNAEATSSDIAFMLIDEKGACKITKLTVMVVRERRILTFEDADWKAGVNYVGGESWSSLIDSKQNNGSLLYPADGDPSLQYNWMDTDNTFLYSEIIEGISWEDFESPSYKFWNYGQVISNYSEMNLENGDIEHQLSVYCQDPITGMGGNNGSDNFCIHFGYKGGMGSGLPRLIFLDGEEHIIEHMYYANTTYFVNQLLNVLPLDEKYPFNGGEYVKVVATGYDMNEEETGTVEFDLYKDGKCVEGWNKVDLSSLGSIFFVEFNVTGNVSNAWGFSAPGYFAFDDVTVIW